MEIFLLFVLLILVIVFHSSYSSRFTKLHDHINLLQKQLNEALKEKNIAVQKQEEVKKVVPPVIVPEQKIVPPVIKVEEKSVEKKKEEIPLVNEKKIEPEIIKIPVIENPQQKVQRQPVSEPQLSWWDNFKQKNPDLEKFIGENLLSKIAITILVLGIAFFVKHAIDQNWINETARVGIGILAGSIVMGFAHRLRLKFKAFSSVLVAGAIAIFYFTIGIGFHEYHLFSQQVAFIIMLVITLFAVLVSVVYDRVELAALAITGGFAVPFMLSTGQGNYKVLFTYILILDLGMLVLAYLKKWNLINILTYAFTVLLYSAWLGTKVISVENAPYKGAFFFGTIFYLVFVLMNVVNNIKERRQFTYIELIILISNTFVFYAAGMSVLHSWQPQFKGVYTIALATFNLILALALYRFFKADKKLVYLLIGTTLTFATLAAPVQLKGNYITLFWAAETTLLIWLAQRSALKGFRLASLIVSFLSVVSLFLDFGAIYTYAPDGLSPFSNKGFITGVATALFFMLGYFLLKREKLEEGEKHFIDPKSFGNILAVAGVSILYLTGFLEVHQQSSYYLGQQNSVVSMSCFYHVTFTSLVGMFLLRKYSATNNIISFILLCINVVYYSLVFSIAPYRELEERCMGQHSIYAGYIVHFVALAALAVHGSILAITAIRRENFILQAKSALLWLFGIFSILILSNETILNTMVIKLNTFVRVDEPYVVEEVVDYIHIQVIKIALPIVWGMIAFFLLSVGIRKHLKQLRIMALVLLGVTLLKLFSYDINDVSQTGKIIAFLLLGVLLLIMAFMYQKIKIILSDTGEQSVTPNPEISDETKTA